MNLPAPQFQALQEQDEFLALFPHRYDYIWAEHPAPDTRPAWRTESRHLLSDRLIQQAAYLYGVRFGKQTRYLMLDIDAKSPYHPVHNPLAIRRLIAALEPLDLVAWVAITSSDSGGLHLYLPFEEEQESWAIAQAASTLLEHAGFKLVPGQLEVFPNPRPYGETGSLYLAHRLPLQMGSYLLNEDFQPVYGTQATFVQQWHRAQNRNTLTQAILKRVLKQVQRKRYRLTAKATKFLNDLNAEIEPGWTEPGQTNYLLGRITMREYIFGHVQRRCEPLVDDALVEAICEVARSLPGFSEYCNHQSDLEKRAQFYARSIQASHYYSFGSKNQPKPRLEESTEPAPPSWNQQQAQNARDRIRQAVADLLSKNALPSPITARKNAIKAYGIGGETLKKYLELWHPNYLKLGQDTESHPIEAPIPQLDCLKPLQESQSHPINHNKLVPVSAAPFGHADGTFAVGGSGGASTFAPSKVAVAEKQVAQMQGWLESGDPILVAEAEQYFAAVVLAESVQKSHPAVVMSVEVESCFAQYPQEPPVDVALAWSAGVYNPLADVDLLAVGARFLEPEEEDWLAIARMVGWLTVEDDLDAIYFTAPPPNFSLNQSDWYVRPACTSFLEEPMLLREVIQGYPIPLKELQGAIAQRFLQLGWPLQQQEQFCFKLFEKPQTELTQDEWTFLLFELERQL